jgi:hypothetical protein
VVPLHSGPDALTDLGVSMNMRVMAPNVFGADHHHMAQGALIPKIASTGMDTEGVVCGVDQVPEGAAALIARIGFMFIKYSKRLCQSI